MSSRKRCQSNIDEFYGEEDFFGKNLSSESEKSDDSEDGSLLSDGDSLVDFYVRMYCISSTSESRF
ncbi:MAG: hypothetical protein V5A68_06170 [Candidatus Thermoplasmatota archaeon]